MAIDEYTVEYLDPEYENDFDDETTHNEEDEQSEDQERKGQKKLTKSRTKRTYPYKCTRCNKRFVYKEVFEAHIRIHKGLPGFTYVYRLNSSVNKSIACQLSH